MLERAAKLLLTESGRLLAVTDFTRSILREVALEQVTSKTFEHLKTAALLYNLPVSDTVAIHEARL